MIFYLSLFVFGVAAGWLGPPLLLLVRSTLSANLASLSSEQKVAIIELVAEKLGILDAFKKATDPSKFPVTTDLLDSLVQAVNKSLDSVDRHAQIGVLLAAFLETNGFIQAGAFAKWLEVRKMSESQPPGEDANSRAN